MKVSTEARRIAMKLSMRVATTKACLGHLKFRIFQRRS